MEDDTLELKAEVERLYQKRCDIETLGSCGRQVHDHCVSSLSGRECIVGNVLGHPMCDFKSNQTASTTPCGTRYTYEHSVVMLHESLKGGVDDNPTDPQVVESICFTQGLDKYLVDKYYADREFWADFGVEPAWMEFGSQ